jgi:hypothetical protein
MNMRKYMKAKAMVKQWNEMRSQIIQAQIAPALVLIALVVLVAIGAFENATDAAKYLAVGVAAGTGFLSMTSQYAAIREAQALLVDLKKAEEPTALSKKIADSEQLLSLSGVATLVIGLGTFVLVVWAVLN